MNKQKRVPGIDFQVKGFCLPAFFIIALFLGSPVWSQEKTKEETVPPAIARELNAVYELLENDKAWEALDRLAALKKKEGGHYLISFALGNCYMTVERYSRARDAYLETLDKSPSYAPAWFNLAKSYFELKQYGLAGDAFVRSADLSPRKNPETLYYAGAAYFNGNNPRKALQIFDQLLSDNPREVKAEWKATLVQVLLAVQQNGRALTLMEELAETTTGPQKKQWREALLHQYLTLHNHQQALNLVRTLTREDPLEPRWWKGLVHIHLLANQQEEALAALMVYTRLKEPDAEEKKLLADLSLSVGIPAQSLEVLEKILDDGWDRDAVKKTVHCHILLQQPQKALEWVEKGISRDPGDKDFLMLKGSLLFSMKSYDKAIMAFNAAVQRDEAMGEAWLMLGYSAWYAEKPDIAVNAMEKALHFDPQKNRAREALQRLKAGDGS
jgi:tetratricopeptide (TPR) repeat protein